MVVKWWGLISRSAKRSLVCHKTQKGLIFMPGNFASGGEGEPARLLPSSILKVCLRRHEVAMRTGHFRSTSVTCLLVRTSQRSKFGFGLALFVLGC